MGPKELEGRLRVQAEMDQLTGMFNRHYMTECSSGSSKGRNMIQLRFQ